MSTTAIDHLNRQLASIQVLMLNAKRYHWTVTGPHFRDYHLRFDELHAALLPMVDELGERVRQLQGTPIHTPRQLESLSVVSVSDPTLRLDAQGMVMEALAGLDRLVALSHEGIELTAQAGDPGSSDLLTGFVQVQQKEAWFLRSMVE